MAGLAVAAGVLLALVWVWLLPIYQAPDETAHFKYSVGIFAAGRLIVPRENPASYPIPPSRIVPYPTTLEDLTGVAAIANKRYLKAPPGYGIGDYFRALDAAVLAKPDPPATLLNPILARYYPVGYYALDAAAMGAASLITKSPTGLFFAARVPSALLLGVSLAFGYLLLRQLGLSRARTAVIMVVMALLPVTTLVSSAVQPDSLSFALVGASLYATLRYRQPAAGYRWAGLAGLSIGLLEATKLQYWVALVAAGLGVLVARRLLGRLSSRRRLLIEAGLLAGPSALAAGFQYWLLYGAPLVVLPGDVNTTTSVLGAFFGGPIKLIGFMATQAWYLFKDFAFGRLFYSFWGVLGWVDTPVIIGSQLVTLILWLLLAAFAIVTLALVLLRQAGVLIRLGRLSARRSPTRAAALLVGNPVLTAYFTFILLMLLYEDQRGIQGRYFTPLLPAVFYVAFQLAPRAAPKKAGRAYRTLLVGLTAFFAVASSVFAITTLQERYYGNGRALVQLDPGLVQVDTPGLYQLTQIGPPNSHLGIDIPPQTVVGVSGWAIDPEAHAPASTVLIKIDDLAPQQAVYGDDSPEAAAFLRDARFSRSGFDLVVRTGYIAPGTHSVQVLVVSADGRRLFSPGPPFLFQAYEPRPTPR